jgi:hypothetical protein
LEVAEVRSDSERGAAEERGWRQREMVAEPGGCRHCHRTGLSS